VIRARELGILTDFMASIQLITEAKSLMLVAFLKIWKLMLPLWTRFS